MQPTNVLITGLPRSGTSYLCELLNQIPNVVAINEPVRPFDLFASWFPYTLCNFYSDLRDNILAQRPVLNKLARDTFVANERERWLPHNLTVPDFTLATKSTFPYLFSLTKLVESSNCFEIVAIVRSPMTGLSAWKQSFPHLRQGDANILRAKGYAGRFLSRAQRAEVKAIFRCEDLSLRRCLLWSFAVRCLLSVKQQVCLVKYEALTSEPTQTLRGVPCLATRCVPLMDVLPRHVPRPNVLSAKDRSYILAHCRTEAEALGYRL